MSSEINDALRAARGSTSFDAAIRAGRTTGVPEPGPGNPKASEEQLVAARLAGLPDELAHRLRGEDLGADARMLRDALGLEAPPSVAFDGGTRGVAPGPVTSTHPMTAAIRAAASNRKLFGGELPADRFFTGGGSQ